MATLNFNQILLRLASKGSILRDTLHSQDGLNLGDIRFCPIQRTLNMQCISLGYLQKLLTEVAFMPPVAEGTLKFSGTTAIPLVFQVNNQHEKITDVYIGLMVHCVESHLYAPEKILDSVSDIEVNLKVACNALKAWGDPGKRCTFCLFVNNYGGTMDTPYCLIYPTSYVKDMEPDHFDTHNNPARTCLCHCICHATLQHMNDNTRHCREYGGSHLILPCGAQYKDQLFRKILEVQNHLAPLTDPITKEPFPMELVGDFRSTDPIFKGCYGDSFLYSDVDLGQLRQWEIHLPPYQGEIPAPPAPSYLQAKQSKATKWSAPQAATPNPAVESPKTKCSGGKGRHHHSLGHSSNTSTPPQPRSLPAPRSQPQRNRTNLPRATALASVAILPSPSAESDGRKWKETHTEDTRELNSTLPVSSSGFDGFCSPTGFHSEAAELHHLNPPGS